MFLNHAVMAYPAHADNVCSGVPIVAPSDCKAEVIAKKGGRRFVQITFKSAQYFAWVAADLLSRRISW